MDVLDTIILLTGEIEHPVLGAILRGHNPQLTVWPAATLADVAAVGPPVLRQARLIAFATDVVVTADVLGRLGYGAYNFHPGPPHFPGWRPAHFAIHRRASEFGATAHVMLERVDSGPIVGVELFPIPVGTTVLGLEELAYAGLVRLFHQLAEPLAMQKAPLPELAVRWSGKKTSRRALAALSEVVPPA